MRMPLAWHKASMSLDFEALTRLLPSIPNITTSEFREQWSRSCQIAAQHQRRGPAGNRIVTLAPTHLAEAGAAIEPARRRVAFIHFENDRPGAEPRQPAQGQVEQPPRQALAAARPCHRDRKNLRSSITIRDRMKPTRLRPTVARWATTLRSSSSCSNSP